MERPLPSCISTTLSHLVATEFKIAFSVIIFTASQICGESYLSNQAANTIPFQNFRLSSDDNLSFRKIRTKKGRFESEKV